MRQRISHHTGHHVALSEGVSSEHEPVLEIAKSRVLKPFLTLLQGSGSELFAKQLQPHFKKVAWMQPEASRRASREMYLLGLRRRRFLQPG